MVRCHVCGSVYKDEIETCDKCHAVLRPEAEQTKNMLQYAKDCPGSVRVFSVLCHVIVWMLLAFLGVLGFTVLNDINDIKDVNFWLLTVFGLLCAGIILLIARRGCFRTYVYSKNTYLVCGFVTGIALLEQIYILAVSGGNFGLVRILCRWQWGFYSIVACIMLYWLFFALYRVRLGEAYRAYYMAETGIKAEEYSAIRHEIEGNKRRKYQTYIHERGSIPLLIAAILILVCMAAYGLHVKKENDAYMEDLQYLTKQVAKTLKYASDREDSFSYEPGRIELAEDDIVVQPYWKRNAAYYNAYYKTDYNLERLDEILFAYAQNMTAEPELYRFGTFVLGGGIVIDKTDYSIDSWWRYTNTMSQTGKFVWDYLAYIENDDSYEEFEDIPSGKIQEIMELYVSKKGDIMAKDLMCRQLLGLIEQTCSYNADGNAVSLSNPHINRPYLFVVLAETERYESSSYDDNLDYGVEEICSEYESFCADGILKENGRLKRYYSDYGQFDCAVSKPIYLRTVESTEEIYAFIGEYVNAHSGSISELEQAESLSEDDYALLNEAYEAYYNQ